MITTNELIRLKPILNIKKLAELAGINKNTLAAKISHNRDLTTTESSAITKALEEIHINIYKNHYLVDY